MKDMDEIKEWRAENYRHTVCTYLMMQKVAFSYSEETGLVFTAPAFFVENMLQSLRLSYGCGNIRINEI